MNRYFVHAGLVCLIFAMTPAVGQEQTTESPRVRLEFLGKEPAADWARAASALEDNNLVPIKTLTLQKGQSPCGAVLEQLNFRTVGLACANEVQGLIDKINPKLPSPTPIGQLIKYPDLPLSRLHWAVGFDTSIPEENDRYEKVKSAWKQFQVGEKHRGTFRQLAYKGVATEWVPPIVSDQSFQQTKRSIDASVDHFNTDLNRYDTRAVSILPNPEKKERYSTPVEWADTCLQHPISIDPPKPPGPSYLTLINGAQPPACEANCTNPNSVGCPKIVLIDQDVAKHPDLIAALQRASSGTITSSASSVVQTASPMWCPMGPFNENTDHATHMAGIMVSSGEISAFQGIAPKAALDSQHIADVGIPSMLANNRNRSAMNIYVYASKFEIGQSFDVADDRLSKPPYVEDIRNSGGLWVVAAGNSAPRLSGKQLFPTDPYSPMILGDQPNIIVVTNCEDCYKSEATISTWANFSTYGLVNVAAAGGTEGTKIPATVNVLQDGLANGTSQATALVAGLAAEMVSCYPQTYVQPYSLKDRVLATSKPFSSPEARSKVSAGAIDANTALLDPKLHWVTVINHAQTSATDLFFCTNNLTLQGEYPGSETSIPVKSIRRIMRRQAESGDSAWLIFYQETETVFPKGGGVRHQNVIKVSSLLHLANDNPGIEANASEQPIRSGRKAPSRPLLYLRGGGADLPQDPLSLDSIEDLLVSFNGGQVLKNYKGCSS